ncbi:MAG TPA: hypothetical protein DCZ94_06835 [Lentisphaeria bacterium]|nr:MAG: hypothetical protein A2X48_10555 [Lentisphaerae bacterium GWF2_49_21]HBC86651.1 hypothetical protein [Lentisphaeria bacterium]
MIKTFTGIFALYFATLAVSAQDIKWEYSWSGDAKPKASVSPFLFGKTWAYTVELDDGGILAKNIAQPLFAEYKFTDAPPGVKSGKEMHFVGNVAVMVCNMAGGNNTILSWEDVKELISKGWDITNHSFWHTGIHWDKTKLLSPDQFKRELFWSQAVFSHYVYADKKAPLTFVYPSGDYNYKPFLKEFNLLAGSRCSGSSAASVFDPKFDPLELCRSNLDGLGGDKNMDPLGQFPKDIKEGTLHIDFSHGIDKKDTVNYKAWQERLKTISDKYGANGADNVWCAPTSALVSYALSAKSAKVEAAAGKVTLSLPANAIESRLTILLEGIPESVKLEAPKDGLIYRQGDKAWITTPVLGKPNAIPKPRVKIGYEGNYAPEIKLEKPMKVAAVRLQQSGGFAKGYVPKISFLLKDGGKKEFEVERIHKWTGFGPRWGGWCLYPLIPDEEAVLASGVEIAADPAFKKVEVWVIDE